jgi:cyclopropane fatty-acyl-phospholipid synthase-like methyltransferase
MEDFLIKKLPQPFGFYRCILKGDHLHFGFWPDSAPNLSMEEAQQQMLLHILSFLPEPPAAILDVGCGLGASAAYLANKGYKVMAIDQFNESIEYARKRYGNSGAEFKVIGFSEEDETIFAEEQYDAVLFQESMQYLHPLDDVIKKTRKILKDKGTLIIGDEVCYDRTIKDQTSVHLVSDFIIALSENGFRIIENEEIGRNVIPTCDFVINEFTNNFDKLVSFFNEHGTSEKLSFFINGWKKQKEWYSDGQMGYEIFVAKKDKFFIKAYSSGDEHKILQMFNRIFSTKRSIDHWYWKFRDNPYGSYKITEVISEEGDLVAHYAGYPVPFYFSLDERKNFRSYQIGDTMTVPEVRNIGRGKTSILTSMSYYFYSKFCEDNLPFIYGFNTANIKKLGMRYLNYKYIDPVKLWVKDISKESFEPFSRLKRLLSGYSIKEIHSISEEWDAFFNRVCDSYILLIRRDSAYLKWRYLDCPDRIHRIFAVYKRGHLIGWSVFAEKENKIIWGDALFDNSYPEAVNFMLYSLFKKEFSGYKCIEGWFPLQPEWWVHKLKGLGFRPTEEPNNLTPGFVIFEEPVFLEKLNRYFYYTIGDSDLF